MGNWKGRGNQYIQLVKVLYCKLLTNGKQLPAFLLEVGLGSKLRCQSWEARVLPLWPLKVFSSMYTIESVVFKKVLSQLRVQSIKYFQICTQLKQ